MNLDNTLAVAMFVIAAAAVIVAANAVVRRSALGMPDGAPKIRYRVFALGAVLIAAGMALSAYAVLELSVPQVGLLGSLVMLAGIGLMATSRRPLTR